MKQNIKKPWKGSRIVNMQLTLPCQFIMLCALVDVTPEKVLNDFMSTLGMEQYGGNEVQRNLLCEYFIGMGYSRNRYTPSQLTRMFIELQSISGLFPNNASTEVIDKHARWRKMYYKWWLAKWREKANAPR